MRHWCYCFVGHSLRRSSATVLANFGATIERLKRFGKWRSDRVAEGYVEDAHYKKETAQMINSALTSSTSTKTSSTVIASQGYKNFVLDDSDIALEDIAKVDNISAVVIPRKYFCRFFLDWIECHEWRWRKWIGPRLTYRIELNLL